MIANILQVLLDLSIMRFMTLLTTLITYMKTSDSEYLIKI